MKNDNTDIPSLDLVNSLEYEILKADVFKTALELDLFTAVYKGHNTIDGIADTLALDLRGVRILMDALCPLGFLQKADSIYNLTPASETYLVRGKETFYGDWTLKTQICLTSTIISPQRQLKFPFLLSTSRG